ncbi:MAG: WG repeat-containing protein [Muribaculaceae bacterium]|nr:WG repeat-containing protein [Muribaculaceae bacterium]
MKRKLFYILFLLFISVVNCHAASTYEMKRQQGIDLFEKGSYSEAAKIFVEAQKKAPANNDLVLWISKCTDKLVMARNERIKAAKSASGNELLSNMTKGSRIHNFDSIGKFNANGVALVRFRNRYGFIDKDSIIRIPLVYDDVYCVLLDTKPGSEYDKFSKANNIKWNWSWDKGQLMSVCIDGEWGYIDEEGKERIPVIYDDVHEPIVFKSRKLIGVGKKGKYGFVNCDGENVIPLQYETVTRFYDGGGEKDDMAAVLKNGKMGFIGTNGETLIPFEYEPEFNIDYNVPLMFRPVWLAGETNVKKDGKYGVIDKKGNTITGFIFDGSGKSNFVQIGNDYKTYYKFPKGSGSAYYFDGKIYESEEDFKRATSR